MRSRRLRAGVIGAALIGVGLVAPAWVAPAWVPQAKAAPTAADLIADGFSIAAMTESPISSTVRVALQRDRVAFLCAIDPGAATPDEQPECTLLSGAAYLDGWEQRRSAEAAQADETRTAVLERVLATDERRCVIDLGQAMGEAAFAFTQAGLDPSDAADDVRSHIFSGAAYTPLGDPSENVVLRADASACPSAAAEPVLAQIRAARSVEPLVLDAVSGAPDCAIGAEKLSAALEARAPALAGTGVPKALERLYRRGLIEETTSEAGTPVIRLLKGCP